MKIKIDTKKIINLFVAVMHLVETDEIILQYDYNLKKIVKKSFDKMKIKYHTNEDYDSEYINFYISKQAALKNNIKFFDNSNFKPIDESE